MIKVFISHSSQDRPFVEQELLRVLVEAGLEPWYAKDSIETASQWERSILQGLKESEWFLLVMSPRSAGSRWVKAEVDWAMDHRWEPRRIVPVLLEDCDPWAFHMFLPQLQHIDYRRPGDIKEARRRLLGTWGAIPASEPPLPSRKAFISYASADRTEVLKRLQMLHVLGIEFSQDLLNLEPGERWEEKLCKQIDECDLFLLFWSNAARQSEWVRKELLYALRRQGGIEDAPPRIIPVVIEGPPPPQPPEELAHLHFNDYLLYLM